MKKFLIGALALSALMLAASCKKDSGQEEFSLPGSVWVCRYLDTDYTMTFGTSDVTVEQFNYKKNRKYWDDAHGTYKVLADGVISFDLKLPVVVAQTYFLEGRITALSGNGMTVKTQDYLNGEPLGSAGTLYFTLKTNK